MRMNHPLQCAHAGNLPSEQSERHAPAPRLAIFVYGTLKSGQKNHEYFCGGVTQIQPATTIGRLYALPAGYPALEIPALHILAHGSADPLADAAVQSRFLGELDIMSAQARHSGGWDLVHGEMITFTDPLRSLPPIDRLEGFHPEQRSLYQRVLLPVFACSRVEPCWTYIMPERSSGLRLLSGVWPS